MSDKLLSYLDAFPQVSSIWVNDKLEHIGGPAEGFVKMSRDEALEAIIANDAPVSDALDQATVDSDALTDPEVDNAPEPGKDPGEELPAEPAATIVISKPPKN